MKNRNYNIDCDGKDEDIRFPEIDFQYAVSKDEVWANLSLQIEEPRAEVRRVSMNPFYRIAIAASLFCCLVLPVLSSFIQKPFILLPGNILHFSYPIVL